MIDALSMFVLGTSAFVGGVAGSLAGARRVAREAVRAHEEACVTARMYAMLRDRPAVTPPPKG